MCFAYNVLKSIMQNKSQKRYIRVDANSRQGSFQFSPKNSRRLALSLDNCKIRFRITE